MTYRPHKAWTVAQSIACISFPSETPFFEATHHEGTTTTPVAQLNPRASSVLPSVESIPCSIDAKIVMKGPKLVDKTKQEAAKRQKKDHQWQRDELDRRWAWGKTVGYKRPQAGSGDTKKGRKGRVLGCRRGIIGGTKDCWRKRSFRIYSLQRSEWDLSGWDADNELRQHPGAPSICKAHLSLRKHKDISRTNSPFRDPPLFIISRHSGARPMGVIPYHRRVSLASNRDTKHKEVLTEAHAALFLWQLSKYSRKSHQVIKQANPLEITNHKTLYGKWDVPSASPVFSEKKKK